MELCDLAANSKSESGAALRTGSGFVDSVESFTDSCDFFRWHSPSVIFDNDYIIIIPYSSGYMDKTIVVDRFSGVINDIDDQRLKEVNVLLRSEM